MRLRSKAREVALCLLYQIEIMKSDISQSIQNYLEEFPQKEEFRAKIGEWHKNKNYTKIEEYIGKEADGFIELYKKIKRKLPDILEET